MATILSGKEVAQDIRADIAKEVDRLKEKGVVPALTVVLVGEDPASQSYVTGKMRACEEVGMRSEVIRMPDTITQQELLDTVERLNQNPNVHGILVQLPLPPQIEEKAVIETIDPRKDVDGFHPINIGKLMIGDDTFVSCTPAGIIELIKRTGTSLKGKRVVVVGRSNIVGKPVSLLLLQEHATVTICHSHTQDLASITKQADVLIVAVGRAGLIGKEHVSPGTVVIDVGVNRNEAGKLVGDVRFDEVVDQAGWITPVPGGVGPLTITMLLQNTVKAAKQIENVD
ncbi:MAG TPA: bifunctional methylenetetrahydrofolate dehydrogenase/methenyltetrahydrofolate cyclohydrolase FolD [Candidatus Bathyarchaeia archaeon]|nr:bifunctional methylenetetrahydrofolate dehydrogenase/methenyltetrahydrofolate cyclohydrolase FolD [Candidatus Bathyarchaeia archaeon]